MHTREKRKLGLTSSFRHRSKSTSRSKNRIKTFKTEESAHKWAAEQKLDKEKYTLVSAKKNIKFKIEPV